MAISSCASSRFRFAYFFSSSRNQIAHNATKMISEISGSWFLTTGTGNKLFAIFSGFGRMIAGALDRIRFATPLWSGLLTEVSSGVIGVIAGVQLVAIFGSTAGTWSSLSDILYTIAWVHAEENLLLSISGVILTANSVVAIFRNLIEGAAILRFDLRIRESSRFSNRGWTAAYKNSETHKVIIAGSQALLYEPAVCTLIDQHETALVISRSVYSLPDPLDRYRVPLLAKAPGVKGDTFNGAKIRLLSSIRPETFTGKRSVTLQRTNYYSDRLTNNIADKTITYEGRPILTLGDWNIDANGRLLEFESSLFSNQLGGSCLLVTEDCQLVYVMQGNRSDENANRLAPSGSGSFDWQDLRGLQQPNEKTLQRLAKIGIERELREEIGLKAPNSDCLHILVGFGRYLYRGGKPEFFSLMFTRARFADLKVKPQEWDYIERRLMPEPLKTFDTAVGLADELQRFVAQRAKDSMLSGPLAFNCKLAEVYLRETKGATSIIKSFLDQ